MGGGVVGVGGGVVVCFFFFNDTATTEIYTLSLHDALPISSVRFRAPKVGDEVEFKPATMGTYWIRLNGRKGARGNRIG